MDSISSSVHDEYGLPSWALLQIKTILSTEAKIQKAVLFGSRAKGLQRLGSDIDIALFGDQLILDSLSNLAHQFDESSLPWKVDLVLINTIDNPKLLDHIYRVGVIMFERELKELPG